MLGMMRGTPLTLCEEYPEQLRLGTTLSTPCSPTPLQSPSATSPSTPPTPLSPDTPKSPEHSLSGDVPCQPELCSTSSSEVDLHDISPIGDRSEYAPNEQYSKSLVQEKAEKLRRYWEGSVSVTVPWKSARDHLGNYLFLFNPFPPNLTLCLKLPRVVNLLPIPTCMLPTLCDGATLRGTRFCDSQERLISRQAK